MGVVVLVTPFDPAVRVALGWAAYALALVGLGGVRPDEIRELVRRVLSRG